MAGRARSSALAVLLAVLAMAPLPAAARVTAGMHVPIERLIGQVAAISAPNGSPTQFTLQTADRVVAMKIAPRATFTALSAEAEVEGLNIGDYAIVRARHPRRGWVALHIEFDVRPVHVSDLVTLVASVVRETPNGHDLVVRLPSSIIRWVVLDAQTKFRVYGPLSSGPPVFGRGDLVHITMRRGPQRWIAVEVDIISGSPPQSR